MNRKALSSLVLTVSLALGVLVAFSPETASAAALTGLSDTMSNQTISATSTHAIRFTTPTGVSTGQSVVITFPSGFNFTGKSISSPSLVITYGASTGAENSTTTAASNSATVWGAVFSGGSNVILTLTAPSGSGIPAGNKVIINYDGTNSINPSGAANYVLTIGGGTFADSGSITVPIITNSQVAVSATVSQSLTFSLGSNTASLGALTTGAVASTSHTMQLASNGISGATVTVSGSTLTSTASSTAQITACAAGCTSTPGSKQFGINLVLNSAPIVGANPTGSAPIAAAATNYNTGNTFRFVTGETVATASQPVNITTFNVSYIANIDALMPAGTYSTSLTYNATANF